VYILIHHNVNAKYHTIDFTSRQIENAMGHMGVLVVRMHRQSLEVPVVPENIVGFHSESVD
jgi:hypothetical protein